MKKKFILPCVLSAALCVPFAVALSGCKSDKNNKADVDASEIYALSAASSVEYLQTLDEGASKSAAALAAQARPAYVTDSDVAGIKNCLTMFKDILSDGIKQTVTDNTDKEGEFKDYSYVLTVTVPDTAGNNDVFTMYYNETDTTTKTDDGETEVLTRLVGVMAVGDLRYDVTGLKEVEYEDGETEVSIEFTTKSKINPSNYIVVEQSVENGEIEYEYKIYENGRKIMDAEIEVEYKKNGVELEFSVKDGLAGQKTKYKITTAGNSVYDIQFKVNGNTDKITARELADGTFTLTYSNGYTETV
ncbi:MAG: hypothetical protein K2O41_01995 [Clostridia bacterium]|nr:hypothetical protein [Clostridia bacterium]